MALDFPATPTIGQTYPNPPVTGQAVYTWDGEKWTAGTSVVGPIYISDSAPPNASNNSLWWNSSSGLLFIRYDDGNSAAWVIACPQPDLTTFLATTPQAFTTAQQAQARQNIAAAPMDSMAFNGMQINGSMDISQEGPSSNVPGSYVADGWLMGNNSAATMLGGQTQGYGFPGLPNALNYYPTVAGGALAAADYVYLTTRLEGNRVARLGWGTANAQPVTVGFWTRHIRTGTYSVALRNPAGDRGCVATYTQNVSDAIEYKTVTFPGCTDGTWPNNTTAQGLQVVFTVSAGSNLVAPATGVWYPNGYVAAPGQVHASQLTTDRFRLTGVIVLPGLQAPPAERASLIMRQADFELTLCKRHLQYVSGNAITIAAASANGVILTGSLPIPMRGTPSVTLLLTNWIPTNYVLLLASSWLGCTNGALIAPSADQTSFTSQMSGISGLTSGWAGGFNYSLPFLKLDARL